MADLVNRVVTLYKADATQAKLAVQQYRGVERDEAKKTLDALNAHNAALQSSLATYAKAAAAIGGIAIAYRVAKDAAKAYLEDLRLESASAGANIEALRKSTNGLVETDKLMAFAGKAMHGVWKLNNEEMERVLRGAAALQKTMGVELEPTINALTEAVAKGSTRALKEFGIEAKDKQGVLRELDKVFNSLGGNTKMAGDDMRRAGVQIADTFDDLQGALGKFVLTLEPAARVLADFVGWMAKAGNLTDWIAGTNGNWGGGSQESRWRNEAADMRKRAAALRVNPAGAYISALATGGSVESAEGLDVMAAELERRADAVAARAAGRAAREAVLSAGQALFGASIGRLQAGIWHPTVDVLARDRAARKGANGSLPIDLLPSYDDARAFARGVGGGLGALGKAGVGIYQDARAQGQRESLDQAVASIQGQQIALNAKRQQNRSFLETVFGTPAEIDAMTESLKLASDVFTGLTDAVAAGFDAWITGQKSIASAFNEAIAEMLRGLAKQMAVEAVKHTAFGFGALAFGPLAGASAAGHFKAAAAFGAGAVLAGAGAKGLGQATGQWSAGAGAGAPAARDTAAGRSSAGENGESSNAPIVVYVGSEVGGMSAIERADYILRAVQIGKRGSQHIRWH
jgi:hypothetical protein